jgi:hypothetical protein
MIVPILVFIIVLIIRMLYLSAIFPYCFSCYMKVIGDIFEKEL